MSLAENTTIDTKISRTRKERSYFMVAFLCYELGNNMKHERIYPIPAAIMLTPPPTPEHDSAF